MMHKRRARERLLTDYRHPSLKKLMRILNTKLRMAAKPTMYDCMSHKTHAVVLPARGTMSFQSSNGVFHGVVAVFGLTTFSVSTQTSMTSSLAGRGCLRS